MLEKRHYILIFSTAFMVCFLLTRESHKTEITVPKMETKQTASIEEKITITKQETTRKSHSQKIVSSSYDKLLYKNTDDIIEQLSFLNLKEDKEAKYLLFSNMTELLKHKPELCMDLAKKTLELELEDQDYTQKIAILIGAIASSKTPEAEKALSYILTDKDHERASIQSAIYLNNFPRPSSTSIHALNTVLDRNPTTSDLYRASSLALGSVASNSAIETSDKLVSGIIKRAAEDPVKKNISIYLSAIGNSGNVKAIDFIKNKLQNDDNQIRSKALLSLRHMEGNKALNLFRDSFISEKNHRVLKTASESFRYLEVSDNFLQTIHSSVLKHESDSELSNIILRNSYLNLKAKNALNDKYQNMLMNLSESCTKKKTIQSIEMLLASMQ